MSASESTQAIAFVLLVIFLGYVVVIVVPFLRRRPAAEGDPHSLSWHVVVPCRDEAAVVGATLERLRAQFPQAHVWVVDDDSDDDTARIALKAAESDPGIHVVQRRRPDARVGKGAALNAAWRALREWLPAGTSSDSAIVVVVDADGRLADNALRQAAGPDAFGDPRTGAAQAAVWMSNREDRSPAPGRAGQLRQWWGRYLVRMQDIEFRTTIAAMQCLRGRTLSVGLGGNGQFARLSALDRIAQRAGEPWHGALLEDYELGLHVMLAGYRNVYLHDTHVEQEALPSARRLLTQRTRWCQGGMQCGRYLPDVFRSPHITNAGALETAYFLVMPFLQLVGVFLWPAVVITMVADGTITSGSFTAWALASWWILPLIVLTGIAPFAMWPFLYRARTEVKAPWWAVLGWGAGYWLYMYQSYACVLRAFARLIAGRSGWAKTRRNAEDDVRLLAREA